MPLFPTFKIFPIPEGELVYRGGEFAYWEGDRAGDKENSRTWEVILRTREVNSRTGVVNLRAGE
eukprot:957905-Prorocentrum_minimum.AAC.1